MSSDAPRILRGRSSILDIETKNSLQPLVEVGSSKLNEGGPQKCGRLFYKYWLDKNKDPSMRIPDVDIKFKVYRLGCFSQKDGNFFCDFMLMLDWVDESLSLVRDDEVPDFKNHF